MKGFKLRCDNDAKNALRKRYFGSGDIGHLKLNFYTQIYVFELFFFIKRENQKIARKKKLFSNTNKKRHITQRHTESIKYGNFIRSYMKKSVMTSKL